MFINVSVCAQVRSNHDRIVRLSSDDCPEKDYPLALKTTTHWQEDGKNNKSSIIIVFGGYCDVR